MLAAAEGKQDIALHFMLCVLPAHCTQKTSIRLFAAGIGLRAFYGALRPMPAYAVRRIDTCNITGLYVSPLAEKASLLVERGERLRVVDCFSFWPCPARLWRLLTPILAAAKGEQVEKHITLPFSAFSAPLR